MLLPFLVPKVSLEDMNSELTWSFKPYGMVETKYCIR